MKLHRHLVEAVASALNDIFVQGYYADKVIERNLRENRRWGAKDRRFFAETTYDMVRWWRRLWFALNLEPEQKGQSPELTMENLFMLVGAWASLQYEQLPPWPEWQSLSQSEVRKRYKQAEPLATKQSVPDWLSRLLEEELPEQMPQVLAELNEPAPVFLRVNTLRSTRESLIKRLEEDGIQGIPASEQDAIVLKERRNVFQTNAFKEGLFEVQDLNSQKVAPFLLLEPGQRVIDACAGAGGKTLHLATLMKNKGRIVAMDIYGHKLEELTKRARRAKLDIVEPRLIDSTKVIKRLKDSADRVLLDVPCSGIGVLRRNPDSKWKLSAERCDELQQLQRDLLSQYSVMVKPGGKMVYATCSILPSENRKQVDAFLAQNEGWVLEEDLALFPKRGGGDGFYMARLGRA